jgi:glutathione transport system permease protein
MSDVTGDPAITEAAGRAGAVRTPWGDFWRRFRRQRVALTAGAFVVVLLALAALAPAIVPYDPESHFDYEQIDARPSSAHWLGVDALGRDILSRLLVGARLSLAAGLGSVALGALAGALLGLVAGYFGGLWDRLLMRACDVLFAFPGILLAIGVVAVLGPGMANVIVAVAVFSVPTFARLVRGNTLALKRLTYVEAARSAGAGDLSILLRHVLPGTISVLLVTFTLRIGTAIVTAASLSFLGMGAQPPTPEWGAMLAEARSELAVAPHVAAFPGVAVFLTVLAFNLLGDGIRDALDPRGERG